MVLDDISLVGVDAVVQVDTGQLGFLVDRDQGALTASDTLC